MTGAAGRLVSCMTADSGPEVLRYTAFSADPAGGNPRPAVVLDAAGLDEERMLAVAAELGYSESAFLTERTGEGAYTIRYFSPKAEVPFCGHATVATALALAERDGPGELEFATAAGPVPVTVVREGGELRATLTSVAPRIEEVADADLAEALAALDCGKPPTSIRSCRPGSPTRGPGTWCSPPRRGSGSRSWRTTSPGSKR